MGAIPRQSVVARVGIGIAAAAIALLALIQGAAQILDSRAPHVVRTIAPWFAAAHAREAELALVAKDRTRAEREAMVALRQDISSVPAVRTLGQLDKGPKGEQLLALALRLSRRDFPTHMAFITRAAEAGDVSTVLLHYSQALRTNRRSWSLLLPPLAQAAADRAVIVPLASELAKRPQWLFFFYREWVKSTPDTRAMVALSREMERRGQPLNRDVRTGLLSRLVQAVDWPSLRDELARARPPCGPDLCLDGHFGRYELLQPVDWSASASDKALVIRTAAGNDSYALDYSFTGPGEAMIARRLMLLPAGDYVFAHEFNTTGGQSATGNLGLTLECADPSGAILSDPSQGTGKSRRTVARVPAACPAQWLTFRVASDSAQPVSGRIIRLWLDAAPHSTR
jgi:hypothetical protein